MENLSATAQLNLTRPALTYQQIVRRNSEKYSGDALYKKVIDDVIHEAVQWPRTTPYALLLHPTFLVRARRRIPQGSWR